MDKTQLFINILNTNTITKIGSKEVDINTHGQERIYVKAMLLIVADAAKLPQC